MKLELFDYDLPPKRIAQNPASPRHNARLMSISKNSAKISHHHLFNLPEILDSNCVLVLNNSRVIPARLHGIIAEKKVEMLFVREIKAGIWEIMVKPGKKFSIGKKITFLNHKKTPAPLIEAEVIDIKKNGLREIKLNRKDMASAKILKFFGEIPLPPYIKSFHGKDSSYQTTFAKNPGSIAAPTAGLHFTKKLIMNLKKNGISIREITLHVGLGTFQEVRSEDLRNHHMHQEYCEISQETAAFLNKAKKAAKKIIAVGTTTARTLESFSNSDGILPEKTLAKSTDLFIYPGYKFRFIDGLLTNFHLPKTSLLMLVSAFGGLELSKKAYTEAIKQKYRFYSFGDAMLMVP